MEIRRDAKNINGLIAAMAGVHPEASFLIRPETGESISFLELKQQSILLSCMLRNAGLEKGDKVALLMDNGLLTAQLFLGAMYGGYVAVPLNVRAGGMQLSFMLDHCDAKVVFVEDQYVASLRGALGGVSRDIRVISANVDGPLPAFASAAEDQITPPAADDVALLMYSSGSTGKPKAAIHTHSSILAHGRNSIEAHQLSSTDRSLLVLPLYHINAECVTLIPTLLSGGSVVVAHRFDVSRFWDWIDDLKVTWSALVPTIISELVDWNDPGKDRRQAAFQRIRFFRSSSAPLSPSLHRQFVGKFNLPLIQAMGSTEGGNIFSNPAPPGMNKIGSPGLPWGFETKIVDRQGVDVAQGESGEVLLRGAGLMRGYYKDSEGTAAVMDGDGWLHTGDLARLDEDGFFWVVGRSKELIIKGGVNIAPRQIDEVLESHPAVLEAAAVGVPDRYFGEDAVAFVVLRSEISADEKELLAFCETRLGHFKTPARIHFLKELPKGPSGKVQRLRLLDPAVLAGIAATTGLANGTVTFNRNGSGSGDPLPSATHSIEQIVASAWAEVLGVPEVDPVANFFALGGHSLLAIQCLSKLREKLPIVLSLADFFENSTVTGQADLVRQRLRPANGEGSQGSANQSTNWEQALLQQYVPPAEEEIPRRSSSAPYPLSPAQQRLWFMEQLNPGVPVYNEAEAVLLTGELDVAALKDALNVIVSRHEVLRSTIRVIDGVPHEVVHESWPLRIKTIDLRPMPPARRQSEVDRLLIDEPRAAYDLEAEPGIRATLIRLGPSEHVFILMMHHIICDWSSEGIIWRELSTLYRSFIRGERVELPALPVTHGDYAEWQQQRLASSNFAEDLAFWEEQLSGAPALLDLPADRARPATTSYNGGRLRWKLSSALTEALRNTSRKEQTSLFTIFAAALDTLLYRYSGSDDILLGIPMSDRDQQELQSVVGFLLHTHVLRTRLSGDMKFRDLLGRVQKAVLDLYMHRSVPFDQIVRKLRPERNQSYSPVFQIMLNWRDRDQQLPFIGLDGLVIESLMAASKTSKFDLFLFVTDCGDEIWLELEYSTDLFDEDRISRMLGHYETVLEAITANPCTTVANISLLTAAERQQILLNWNRTEVSHSSDKCVDELIGDQIRCTPDAIAVVFGRNQMTYRQLGDRADRLAAYLQKLGVCRNTLVAICLDRSEEMLVALLGILIAGGAYLPLDPTFPPARLAFMMQNAEPIVLITQKKLKKLIPSQRAKVVCLEEFPSSLNTNSVESAGRQSEDLAYVIYTSGSTGTPKGVQVQHRALVNFLTSMQDEPGIAFGDRLLAITTLSFDIAGLELFLPLTVGACVVIASSETARDGTQLLALINTCRPTIMQATPATWRMLLDSGWQGHPELKILCGGEPWSTDLASELLPRCQSLWNMYGPTETTIWSAVSQIERDQPIRIGKPIANTTFYVLDELGQPLPVGIPGELHIGGTGLALGYLGRTDLTRERFISDHFNSQVGARLYKTGDLVRRVPHGSIEFLRRVDHQVKIRGFRIELGEIEAQLSKYPGVGDAVVIAREDTPGDKRLVAYYTESGTPEIQTAQLRSHLSRVLPDYMTPSAYMRLESMPLTPNGKIDRRALRAPGVDAGASHRYEAPSGETEIILATIWADILKVDRVGRNDNFFELGGHSLLSLTLVERMRRKGLSVDIRTLFVTRTLAELAAATDRDAITLEAPPNLIPSDCKAILPEMLPLVQLTPEEIRTIVASVSGGAPNVQDIYPLAPLQEGILFHHLVGSDGDPYLLAVQLSFDSRARLDGYLQAMQRTIDRHDILRTSVFWEGLSEPVQVVWREARLELEEVVLDPSGESASDQFYKLFDPRKYRLDIRQAPMLRVNITRDERSGRWLMMQLLHHLVGDAQTLGVMRQEIQEHLLGESGRLTTPLPFRNLVAQARQSASSEGHEAFFQKMLGDVNEPTAPFGLTDVRGDGKGVEEAKLTLDSDLAQKLRVSARRLNVSAASVFHLAWAQVLAKVTGREDVVFGTVLFGRMHGGEGVDRVMGLFINTLPIRISIGNENADACVRRTHRALADLLRHEHASLALAQRCSAVPARTPLFSALLNYRYGRGVDQTFSAEAVRAWEGIQELHKEDRTNYPFVLSVSDLGEGFVLSAQTLATVGPLRVCEFMRTALESLAEALENAPDKLMRDLEVLPSSERHRLLHDWNDTAAGYPADKCVDQLFEEQVAKSPGAVAVVFQSNELTYAELSHQVNRLAHYLRELGAGPGDCVALFVERSLEMVVGLLGILRAGAAYLPLDPRFPSDRLAFMLQDAQPIVLLTQQRLRTNLPPHRSQVVCLDALPATPHRQSIDPAGREAKDLAYVLYTSGSTGVPKGVQVQHRALVNFLISMRREPGIIASDTLLAITTLSFDIAGLELFLPLIAGARVVIASSEVARDGKQLSGLMKTCGATIVQATPATWWMLLDSGWQGIPELKILCGGESWGTDLAAELLSRCKSLWNMYGPTETTIWSSVSRVEEGKPVLLGRPIANTTFYVLDSAQRLLPVGVTGELYIGGRGLALGYRSRADLTQERFVDDPYSEEPGARLYKTGDLVRRMEGGEIKFLGRIDHQVKIRGFRIELGEIETRLMEHESVSDAVVVAHEDMAGDKRLVAYVVRHDSEPESAEARLSHIQDWQDLWKATYRQSNGFDEDFNIAGWKSSYTGEQLPAKEMRIWVEETVSRIRELGPRRVVEIGCGTGLLLTRLAADCESYVGLDFSGEALEKLRAYLFTRADLKHVELRQALAHELSSLEDGSADLVILNSVVQYFPSVDYLLEVLAEAARITRGGGHIFVGDVRSLPLLEAFHASVQLSKSSAKSANATDLQRRIIDAQQKEEELVLDPQLFEELGRRWKKLGRADVSLKPGCYDNELARFRFDVVMSVGVKEDAEEPEIWLGWDSTRRWREKIEQILSERPGISAGVRGVPDGRVRRWVEAARTLTLKEEIPGEDPDEVMRFAQKVRARISWQSFRSDGVYDVVFNPRWRLVKGVDDVSWDYYRRYANAPARSIQDQDVGLVLREYLSARLPDYMVPVSFVCLQSLPRTANGKLDRAALTVSNFTSIPGEAALESPRDPIEVNLVEIWERLLGARPVGIRTNFFDLGGHSLLVVRLFAQIDRVFHCSLPIAAIFESPTITQLATLIRGRSIDPASDAIQVSENLAKARCSVVPIKPTGTAAPLFIIHGILGNIVGFYRLAMLIGTERPVYGIQAQSLLAGQPALLRLEDQAAHYISEIRKIQPRGPYYLLGYCFGGMIALEIAQQLRAQGEQVEMLGLLDAYRRATVAKVQCNDSMRVRLHRRIALYLANFAHLSLSEKVTYLPKRLVTRTLRRIYGAAVSLGFHSVPSFLRSTEDILRVAGVRYRPRPWPGPVTLFRASDQPDPRLPLDLGWAPLAEGGVEVFEVPGDHYSIFGEPNIQILAERLHARLERSDACDSELCELAYSSE